MYYIKHLLPRALCGYALIVPILFGYFFVLHILKKKQRPLHIAVAFLFSFYLFAILAATGIGNTWPSSFSPEIILVPFRDLLRAPRHLLLNIAAFVPFGIFLPLLYGKFRNIISIVLTGFLFSLSIELLQMFGWGATELDDLLANTFGVCLGYWAWHLIATRFKSEFSAKFQAVHIHDATAVALFSACTFLIMAVIRPVVFQA